MADTSLLRELTETKERAFAWVFRGFMTLVMVLLGIIGYFMTSTLTELKSSIKDQLMNQSVTQRDLGALSSSISNAINNNQAAFARIEQWHVDHETRIRQLEMQPIRRGSAN